MGRKLILKRDLINRGPLSSQKLHVLVSILGISLTFVWLSPSLREMIYVLRTRAPLYNKYCYLLLVRLACVRHAASVRSEPESNSPYKIV